MLMIVTLTLIRMASNNFNSINKTLNIASYNMHGFNQGANTLNYFCNNGPLHMDIIFVQEHWLSFSTLDKIK